MKKVINIFFLLSILFFCGSCLDVIDFDRPDTIENGVVVQGKLAKGNPSVASVSIRKLFDFSSNAAFLNAREVLVIDEDGNQVELKSDGAGNFVAEIPNDHPTFNVDYGKSYKAKVSTFDGRNFESAYETLYPVSKPDNLRAEITQIEAVNSIGNIVMKDVMSFFIDTPLKPQGSSENVSLLWELEAVYKLEDSPESYSRFNCWPTRITNATVNKTCYITSSPIENYVVLDGTELTSERVDDFKLYDALLNYFFENGYYFNVYQQSLSPTALDYWNQVNTVVAREGSIFQDPVGKIPSNFSNLDTEDEDVFGFFYATEQEVIRVFVSAEEANNPNKWCPQPLTEGGQAPADCCDCLTELGSTTTKPSWWIQ